VVTKGVTDTGSTDTVREAGAVVEIAVSAAPAALGVAASGALQAVKASETAPAPNSINALPMFDFICARLCRLSVIVVGRSASLALLLVSVVLLQNVARLPKLMSKHCARHFGNVSLQHFSREPGRRC
jgi:hypothetical protein